MMFRSGVGKGQVQAANRSRRRSRTQNREMLQKPHGLIHPRVQMVGPEHFAFVAVLIVLIGCADLHMTNKHLVPGLGTPAHFLFRCRIVRVHTRIVESALADNLGACRKEYWLFWRIDH